MYKAKILIDKVNIVGDIDPNIYGSFIEHTGKCVYDGVYNPEAKNADENGFNKDVIEAYKEMKLPIVRYPGGSYVATWDWRESIGPKSERKTMYNLPWHEIEPNTFGIGEAVKWARKVGCEIMMCLNISTMSLLDNLRLLEYCNFPKGTYYSDLRRSHGYEEPFNIKYWSMGNEPDGWWQINLETEDEYARISAETAKAFKFFDPELKIIACSGLGDKGYKWTKTTLKKGYKHYDFISMHRYMANKQNCFPLYMAKTSVLSGAIDRLTYLCDEIGQELGFDKRIMVSLDEWNVWYHSLEADSKIPYHCFAPHRLEDIYNMEDALSVGEMLMAMIKKCDRVKIGCMAQLVNVIAPLFTNKDGDVLKQSIYYPYRDACLYGRGVAINNIVESPAYDFEDKDNDDKYENVAYIDSVTSFYQNTLTIFIVNRSENEAAECEINVKGFEKLAYGKHKELYHDDIKAENSFENPDKVSPKEYEITPDEDAFKLNIKPHSWNMISLKLEESGNIL